MRFIAIVLVLSGCTDRLDREHLGFVGASLEEPISMAQSGVYIGLWQPAKATLVSGPREQFTVDGTIENPFHHDPAAYVTGTGSATGLALDMTLSLEFADGRDDFFETTRTGTLEIVEHALYRDATEALPEIVDATITGTVHMTDELAGDHAIEMHWCDRNLYSSWVSPVKQVFGWHGTVDGVAVDDGVCP